MIPMFKKSQQRICSNRFVKLWLNGTFRRRVHHTDMLEYDRSKF
jgi:hypothetical protein